MLLEKDDTRGETKYTLIKNATIVNEGRVFVGHVFIEGERIRLIDSTGSLQEIPMNCKVIDAEGLLLLPGAIDDQVHFREPGLTHKGDINSE